MRLIPRAALLGVDDKSGVGDFAKGLRELGVDLYATAGTQARLTQLGVACSALSDLTGLTEMLGGRVKTLHPAVHAGILARRDRVEDMEQLSALGWRPIDMVVVNLYPFERRVAEGADRSGLIEAIDIGGPTMLRAAAKNWSQVAAVSSPGQYGWVLAALRAGGLEEEQLRRLAEEVFFLTSGYDQAVARQLRSWSPRDRDWPARITVGGTLREELRYGENPHQRGAIYRSGATPRGVAAAEQLQGDALSYVNWLDADAAWRLVRSLDQPAAVVVKHGNPCGLAVAEEAATAFLRAYDCDPRSAYGGVVALNRPLSPQAAAAVARHFLQVLVVPDVDGDARQQLARRSQLRVLRLPASDPGGGELEIRSLDGGFLAQDPDPEDEAETGFRVVSRRAPSPGEWEQLRLAWHVVAGVRSNAIVLCRLGMAVGVGAGQMSRVEAVQLAVQRAGERAGGSCLASDAFFPMADGLELAAAAGVTAAIHPGGSVRDQSVIDAADAAGMALVATGVRHFRH